MFLIPINIVLCAILLVGVAYAYRKGWRYRQYQQLQVQLIEELKLLVDKYASLTTKKEKRKGEYTPGDTYDLSDPLLLSSLITVMVSKGGVPIRLSLKDFANVSADDYVRVYVDAETNDLILSTTDPGVSEALWMFGTKDDDPVYN
jgi:hypothetical protein